MQADRSSSARLPIEPTGRRAATNDQGQFRISDLPAGDYTVTSSYVGFAPSIVGRADHKDSGGRSHDGPRPSEAQNLLANGGTRGCAVSWASQIKAEHFQDRSCCATMRASVADGTSPSEDQVTFACARHRSVVFLRTVVSTSLLYPPW
jgi:hypothetical protein